MSQRANAPSARVALAASATLHALALLALAAAVQPWTLVRASARQADAWIETALVVREPPRDDPPPAVAPVATEAAPARVSEPHARRTPRAASAAPAETVPLTTIETGPESALAASPSGDPEGDAAGQAPTGEGEATASAHAEPPPRARCDGDPIAGMWHGFAIRTMANYRATGRDWFFHADVFLWIRRVGASLQGASMVHEWSSATRSVTQAPCADRDFDRTLWMGVEGELDDLALRMRNTASAANVVRAGACGEQRFIDSGTSDSRTAGHERFELQRIEDEELIGVYRSGSAGSELQLTRQACGGDVRWPRW